jgi:hypothetical protein
MPDVKPHQVWEVYSKGENRWSRTCVVNVLGDEVELQYLDMPTVPDVARTERASRARMLSDQRVYRLVADVP